MSCRGLSSVSIDKSASILVLSTTPSSWLVSRSGIGDGVAADRFVGEVGREIGLIGVFFAELAPRRASDESDALTLGVRGAKYGVFG